MIRSRNFVLVGNASESSIKRVGRELEEFRSALGNVFQTVNQESPIGTTVVVFKDDASFRPYKPLYDGKPANVAGFFQAGEDANFIALTADIPSPHVVYHEFVHSLTKDTATPLPPWTNEGLAELYSMFELSGREILLGRAITEHVLTLRKQTMLPLEVLFSVGFGSPYYNEKTKQGIFYAESWASVHYLLFGNNRKRLEQFSTYLKLSGNGQPIEDNFRQAFGTDYKTLGEEIRKYIQDQVAWPAIKIKLQDKLDFDRDMQASALTEAQAEYYLGDLLLHMNRLDAAETHLQRAVVLEPEFITSYGSLGLLKIRQANNDEAIKYLARAVERDSKNHLAHFYYAQLLQQLNESSPSEERSSRWSLMRTHLKRTIELVPRFVQAYSLLGYVAIISREGLVEAETTIKKGIEYAPGRLELRLTLAQIMLLNNEVSSAQGILTALQNNGVDEMIRYKAGQFLDQIRNQQTFERDLRAYEQRAREIQEAAARTPADTKLKDEPPKLTRNNTAAPPATESAVTPKTDPRNPEGTRIEGSLVEVECSSGLTLRLRVMNTIVELHTDAPAQVEFVSYVSTVKETFSCGALNPDIPVAIVYKRTADNRFLGDPIRVEFIQRNRE